MSTLVIIGYETNTSSKERPKEEEEVSSNNVIVQEKNDSDADVGLIEVQEHSKMG